MRSFQVIIGAVLLLIGVLTLLTNILHLDYAIMDNLWFLFILAPGLYFEVNYFQTKQNPGQLVPGGILSGIGLISLFEILTQWQYSDFTSPITILCLIALFLYLNLFVSYLLLFSIFLIGLGLYILFKKR